MHLIMLLNKLLVRVAIVAMIHLAAKLRTDKEFTSYLNELFSLVSLKQYRLVDEAT